MKCPLQQSSHEKPLVYMFHGNQNFFISGNIKYVLIVDAKSIDMSNKVT